MKILIISPIEIYYEPRLRKSADYFSSKGNEVHILSSVKVKSDRNLYEKVKNDNPKWIFHEFDISKKDLSSKRRWLIYSLVHLIVKKIFKYFSIQLFKNRGILSKSFIISKLPKEKFDWVLVNLIDTLPIAIELKKKRGSKIIYDSQEFFTGQYSNSEKYIFKWVSDTEKEYISKVDLIIGTTNVMVSALKEKYNLKQLLFRIRNLPLKSEIPVPVTSFKKNRSLQLIWHGKSINIGNTRGVHIIVEAVLRSTVPVSLYLQGTISEKEKIKLNNLIGSIKSNNQVSLLPSANPMKIVSSLQKYDAGIIGEIPTELNQQYTSSNKLFDFISANLAIISPNIDGLIETIDEYNNGIKYIPGDISDLTNKIEMLSSDPLLLANLKKNSLKASKTCFWENDYLPFYDKLTEPS